MSEEFSIPSAPNFTKYLLENFGKDISLGEFSAVPVYRGVLVEVEHHIGRIGPHSFGVPVLLNGYPEEIGRFNRYITHLGGFTLVGYHGSLPGYYNDNPVCLTAIYEGEYALWESLEGKTAERKDGNDSIPFP